MIQNFKAWLKKPYYMIDSTPVKLSMTLGVGLFTFLFLFVFRPFGIDNVIHHNPFLIVGYGLLVSFSLYISYFILPKIFPIYFNVRSWTVQKEATFLLITFLIITTINYFYHIAYIDNYMPSFSYLKFMFRVFSIGIFPVMFIIFMIEKYLQTKLKVTPDKIVEQIRKEKKETIIINSDNIKEDSLTIDIDSFLYAQSNNNYTTIVYLLDEKPKKVLMRITLKKVEDILSVYPEFIRCHRSFIINKSEVLKVEGNARALQVTLKNVKETIPVSRSFPKEQIIS
ncbi:LytR/AlgR family response regulator transcription factor [Wenyingzhuangia marina]|uniref:Transcriptional regulator, LytTR family n=1 Tax=Wenyingzhuangia marina TaxID=1195760 RepID=A0A1M5UIX6_9FLAO|nr:LytTR family DNA-binding domain-containing protein [Wenyingzhuangia marina]GGF67335.1 hypothetical protein GCM10011397_08020 [Wenyingzhuangia marina]SHH63032.1 transcriptional regulator, LytTR family [Wenyingzhuangia marina]